MPLEKPQHRIAVLADQCVQCGLCLPVCPTYRLDGNEAESPRGRIALAAALAHGQIVATSDVRNPIDHCLGCLNCQRACPAGVQYEELLVQTRGLLGPRPDRPRALLEIIKRPKLNRWLQRLARWTGAAQWARSRLKGTTDPSWLVALSLVGRTAKSATFSHARNAAPDDGTVALFPGCAASVHDAEAEHAAEALLQAAGYRVKRLAAFCCGALDLHDGATLDADEAAERLRRAWRDVHADFLVTVTPGCLSTLRRALPNVRIDDPIALIAERADRLSFRSLPLRVALHVPCTQANVARSDAALVQLLKRVPDLDIQRLPAPPYCCGAAGSHVLQFPDRANRLRDEVIAGINTLDAQRVLSSNIGCRLHLAAGLSDRATSLQTLHPLTLLAQQLDLR